jgi:hypothetical protein
MNTEIFIREIIVKSVLSILLCLFSIVSIAAAEVIDVNIKGVDDGIKTSRQQDYQEAVMNAKLQAIERAGAAIESITQVVNFQLKYDAVESKSKAILLPGFQIIDIGYVADGTYQVVLTGKIQTGGKEMPSKDGRFIAYNNGTVLDTKTNLMWAAKDNGSNINWSNAKSYCENYRGGDYTDWRMPTQDELAGLYDPGKSRPAACNPSYPIHVSTELVDITCFTPWSSETRDSEAAFFFFNLGQRSWVNQSRNNSLRALPVRSGK